MAGPINNINFMALANPAFAAKQLQAQQQQALAQQLMEEGSKQQDPAQLANPGGFVVPVSKWGAASKAVEKGVGAYMNQKAMADQLAAYKDLQPQSGQALPWRGDMTADNGQSADQNQSLAQALTATQATPQTAMNDPQFMRDAMVVGPEEAYKNYTTRTAPTDQQKNFNDPSMNPLIKNKMIADGLIKTPQGTYISAGSVTGAVPASPSAVTPPAPTGGTEPPPAAAPGVGGGGSPPKVQSERSASAPLADRTAQPVTLTRDGDQPSIPSAADGKPILPDQKALAKPDPSGTPKYNTENTETGVNQTKLFQDADIKSDGALTASAASLANEQFRLQELAKVYKDVQSGTLTAQNPELANKLVAWGVVKDPAQIKDLAGVQNALQSHVLQVIQQIKDTNANLGGAPTRTFGSEIKELMDKGESPGAQPEALWNIISQAKGLVDHHLDMINGWNTIGGLGNRQANGYTLRPEEYTRQFIQHHDIQDYRAAAQNEIGPFKGMAGNPAAPGAGSRPPLSSFMK